MYFQNWKLVHLIHNFTCLTWIVLKTAIAVGKPTAIRFLLNVADLKPVPASSVVFPKSADDSVAF